MKRLFVSIPLPEFVCDELMDLMSEQEGFFWTPLNQLHVTLVFIGATPEHLLPDIEEALLSVRASSFRLTLDGVGVFSGPKDRQVLWVGLKPNPDLLQLYHRIRSALLSAGLELDRKRFKPHITLARLKKTSVSLVQAYLQEYTCYKGPVFDVNSFSLYESFLNKQGAYYDQLSCFDLS